jgi:predicted enzyme related to lactoylglutathione lyase
VGSVEFQLYGINEKDPSSTPPMQLSFEVDNLDTVFAQLSLLAGVDVIMEPTELPDGKRTIVLDPDGQSIELTQISKPSDL